MAVGELAAPGCPMDASGSTAEISTASPSRLPGYRAAVADLIRETSRHLRRSALLAAEGLLVTRLAQRQAFPAIRPRTAGLRLARSRPAVVAVVNQIARELAAALPPRTPRLWLNSLVRSVQHQHHLRSLGYTAALPSSHCVGYACDVEMLWFRRFDPNNLLSRLLSERQEAGQLNVIDEGQAWHLCVSPRACDELQAAYDAQLGVR